MTPRGPEPSLNIVDDVGKWRVRIDHQTVVGPRFVGTRPGHDLVPAGRADMPQITVAALDSAAVFVLPRADQQHEFQRRSGPPSMASSIGSIDRCSAINR
jgi:hypothetical protein